LTIIDFESIIESDKENESKNFTNHRHNNENFEKAKYDENNWNCTKDFSNNNLKIFLNENDIFGDNNNKRKLESRNLQLNSKTKILQDINKAIDTININKLFKYLIKIFEIRLDLIGKKINIYLNVNKCIP